MPRRLTDHIVNPVNDRVQIAVLDDPGPGGASHDYGIAWQGQDLDLDPSALPEDYTAEDTFDLVISFQNGPIAENGVNGVTQEALLAIVIDRLRSFQEGPFRCRENAIALTHFEEGLMWLLKRTRDRMARGVEGTDRL